MRPLLEAVRSVKNAKELSESVLVEVLAKFGFKLVSPPTMLQEEYDEARNKLKEVKNILVMMLFSEFRDRYLERVGEAEVGDIIEKEGVDFETIPIEDEETIEDPFFEGYNITFGVGGEYVVVRNREIDTGYEVITVYRLKTQPAIVTK